MKFNGFYIVAGVCAVLLVISLLGASDQTSTSGNTSAARDAMSADAGDDVLQARMTELEQQLERLKNRNRASDTQARIQIETLEMIGQLREELEILSHRVAELTADGQLPPTARKNKKPSVAEQEAQMAEKIAAQEHLFETTFAAESKDEQWSLEAENTLTAAFTKRDNLQLDSLSCATTLCRLQGKFQIQGSDEDPEMSMRQLSAEMDWDGAYVYKLDQQSGEVLAFFARSGNDLPSLEE